MGLFKKKDRIIDLTEHYRKQQEKEAEIKQDLKEFSESQETSSGGALSFLGSMVSSSTTPTDTSSRESEYLDVAGEVSEKRKKLAKRFMEMTEKLEDLSNQIYHLQQRLEVIEKKLNIGSFS